MRQVTDLWLYWVACELGFGDNRESWCENCGEGVGIQGPFSFERALAETGTLNNPDVRVPTVG